MRSLMLFGRCKLDEETLEKRKGTRVIVRYHSTSFPKHGHRKNLVPPYAVNDAVNDFIYFILLLVLV